MPPKPSKTGEKSEAEAAVSKADLVATLADHRAVLVSELKNSCKEINKKLDGLQQTVNTNDNGLTSLEENAETVHQHLDKVEALYDTTRADNQKLRAKLTHLEGRNRRTNVRLVGLPEGIEGPRPTNFFPQMLQEVFGREFFPSAPELEGPS